jgi:hypothetical protein
VSKIAVSLAVALLALQADDPNLKYLKERGFSISKPPKKDEWQFKDKGRFTTSQLVVQNIVTDVSIEMYSEELNSDKLNYDPKYTLELLWKSVSSNGRYKEVKEVGKIAATTFPGKGAGGQRVWLLDMTLNIEDVPMEWKAYCFVGHENRSGFIVYVLSKAGLYAKHKTDLEYMLSTIKTYKIPK